MNKRVIYFLIGSISLALVGMIVVQALWINNAFNVKEEMFNRRVNDALGSVVENMETQENMYYITRNYEGDSILQIVKAFTKDSTQNLQRKFDSLMMVAEISVHTRENQVPPSKNPGEPATRQGQMQYSYHYNITPSSVIVDSSVIVVNNLGEYFPVMSVNEFSFQWNEEMAFIDSLITHETEVIMNGDPDYAMERQIEKTIWLNQFSNKDLSNAPRGRNKGAIQHYSPDLPKITPKPSARTREDKVQKLENKAKKIQEVIKQMAVALETKPAPIHQRINKSGLQAALTKAMQDKGIDLSFEFAVYSPSNDTNLIPIRSTGFESSYKADSHKISLFPNDLFKKPDMLLVHFNGQKAAVFKSLYWLLIGSFLFTLIIVFASGTSFVVMIRQKRISDIKTDFINNMTHEFKTPIATISIAADSINNAKVLTEPETIRNFTRIIKEENNRMNTRVEQVLQMALLDSRDFRLRPSIINMNDLIEQVVDHYRLQVEKRGGSLEKRLEAIQAEVLADEDHIRNVLLNLLDNANKYSLGPPEITIFSFNRSGKYTFGVADKGIGMSSEAQRRVFDKFFRVTTGNIHNIKGFGLGLSYVKAIVLAHKGEINIVSELGKGSRFEIGLEHIKS